jgi:hypothetical protein
VDASTLPVAPESDDFVAAGELAALKLQQTAMQCEIDELRAAVERLYAELGVARH